MCRQYNDYGSIARDRAERNLDSINFPEFGANGGEVVVDVEERLKEDLYWIAEYERECLGMVVSRLEGGWLESEGGFQGFCWGYGSVWADLCG